MEFPVIELILIAFGIIYSVHLCASLYNRMHESKRDIVDEYFENSISRLNNLR